ncbi:hypothetical protein Tcan_07324 [Toxocara canis]|uniref:Uncharacterized protein n=1 Tax=Toxocara canis TaxID=6265 RepID=A0A0B2V8H9_TOXCA|nr:hypothetical protein Tcan_07324 [Toxocara canis]
MTFGLELIDQNLLVMASSKLNLALARTFVTPTTVGKSISNIAQQMETSTFRKTLFYRFGYGNFGNLYHPAFNKHREEPMRGNPVVRGALENSRTQDGGIAPLESLYRTISDLCVYTKVIAIIDIMVLSMNGANWDRRNAMRNFREEDPLTIY